MSEFKQRSHDFSKGMVDAQFAYIEAERRVIDLEAENDKLCELVEKMARALGVGSGWCIRECGVEFGCTGNCAIVDTMEELGWPIVEVDE